MRVKHLMTALLAIVVLSMACPLRDTYLNLRADYIVFREIVKDECEAGTVDTAKCAWLKSADEALVEYDRLARDVDAGRLEIRTAIEELEAVIKYQRAVLTREPPPE
ncbi:hypothetical protein LCGC14_0427460 [marine sediment metagenome]|uniref:Uncharacterized protein n=1 Tax=marine sediment metagenome TaxID=412755 RepID=A0A0F9VB14_9ZZZZ